MKVRKLLFLLLFVILGLVLFIPNTVNANVGDELKIDGFKYEILTETEGDYAVELTGYEGALEEVEIPSTITSGANAYIVTSIAERAFWLNNEQVKSITIPSSIISIEDMALNGSTKLEKIIVKDGNTKYSSVDGVLFNQDKTKLIFYPEGKATSNYNIPNTVKVVGKSAFYRCRVVENVTIPNTVTKIEDFAFLFCEAIKEIEIPNSVTSIGVRAFSSCNALEKIVIPDSVYTLGWGAFESCASLENITLPNSITVIPERLFYGCSILKNVVIPNSVTTIREYAFGMCQLLEQLEVPDSVITIENYAFVNCDSLTTEIYYVTTNLTNILSNGKNYVFSNTQYYTTTLSASAGYKLPNNIVVKINGTDLSLNDYEYDSKTGNLKIEFDKNNGNIEIEAIGNKIYKVSFDANGGKYSNGNNILSFEDCENCDFDNLDIPTKNGYKFIGYYTEKIGGISIENIMNSEEGINSDMTFYARWEEQPIEEENESEGTGNANIDTNANANTNLNNNNTVNGNNPQTSDNIMTFVIILGIAVIGIVTTTKVKKYIKE